MKRRDVCSRSHHLYLRVETCAGVIWECANCWNWTMKRPIAKGKALRKWFGYAKKRK